MPELNFGLKIFKLISWINITKMAAFSIGNVGEYNEMTETWKSYTERVQQFFLANEIPNDRKVPALLAIMGGKTYGLLRNLTTPEDPATKSYNDIVKLLNDHLSPKPLVIAERFRFHKRDQKEGESLPVYVAELRKLSEHCDFEANLNDALRDRLVCGIRNENIQKKLLSESDLTLQKAINIATAMETAAKDAVELQHQHRPDSVHKISKNQTSYTKPKQKNKACFRCDRTNHTPDQCRFKDETCRFCSKKGHIERACLSKKSQQKHQSKKPKSKSVKTVEEEELLTVSINTVKRSDVISVTPMIEGKFLKMELDTGSAISVIPIKTYKQLFSHKPLSQTNTRLKTYTGQIIKPAGTINVSVDYEGQQHNLDLFVVKNDSPALFGRAWLKYLTLDWNSIKFLQTDKSVEENLQDILQKYNSVFTAETGIVKGIKATLTMKENAQPKFCKARPVPYALKEKVEKELERLEKEGIIQKVDHSDWATPIVPVPKGDNTVRICGDYKTTVNPQLKVDQYPLPKIEDIFASLAGGQRFTKIDLRQAYNQLEMEDNSKKYLTINTHKGLYSYNRLVFGIAASPSIWQRTMDQVLKGIPNTSCILDDMIITGTTDEEHLKNIQSVLQKLQDFNLRVNKEKCSFFQEEITYCGHKIDSNGLHKTKEKIEAVINAPKPENVTQLRAFLGLVNYYSRFLPNIASVLHPLYKLLKKDVKYTWTAAAQKSFETVKDMITSDTVLTHYNPNLPVRLACDASAYGLGAVISHVMENGEERPIAFASRSLNAAEKNYAQIQKEALALIWGVKKFHCYLYGRKFTLVTDHQPLISIFGPKKGIPATTAARMQRYAIFLQGHDYEIEYKTSKSHANCDGLSRLPCSYSEELPDSDPVDIYNLSQIESLPVSANDVKRETRRDPILSKVLDFTLKGWTYKPQDERLKPFYMRRSEISVQQGCLMWGIRVIVPIKLRNKLLEELHNGHIGIVKMKELSRSYFWWPKLDSDIEQLARSCSGCQINQKAPKKASLHPWEWPSAPWERIHIDFAGPFLGHMFFIAVDAHSKWPEIHVMNSITSTKTIDVLRQIFARFGVVKQIVSDNGPTFTSELFQTFVKNNGIIHKTSVPWHPATQGLVERFVQTFKLAMKSASADSSSLNQKIGSFLLAYRNAPHATTNESPAKLFLGRNLRSRLDLIKPNVRDTVEKKQFESLTEPKRPQFNEGENVMVRDYRDNGKKWTSAKITEKKGPLSYKVMTEDQGNWRRHADQMIKTSVEPRPQDYTSDVSGDTSIPGATGGTVSRSSDAPAQRRYPLRIRKPPERLSYQ
ncbi:MAG: RNase H-like domain-containing protein [Candidatus Thiodiazotropha taylori]|nr:DDE-type integrase/transposase/recombinase [Candidatus Thiodiazotropha taylori]MCW4285457.1 RNase H-like domain-containing protein [Candidatus Thiodiazotropha taylori]